MKHREYSWPYGNEVGQEEIIRSDVLVLGGNRFLRKVIHTFHKIITFHNPNFPASQYSPARGASSKPFLLYISSARQQAAKCPGATSRRGIAPFRHSSVANGHLTANRHPGFGFTGLVTSPCRSSLFL